MSLVTTAKKPFVWVCIIVALCCLILIQQNSTGVYQFAVNARQQALERIKLTRFQDPQCDEQTECRMRTFRERIRHVCLRDRSTGHGNKMKNFGGHLNHEHQLLYFAIPKVGCSFWKRIFKVLNAQNNETSMFDIPNYRAHSGPGLVRANTIQQVNTYLPTYTSFLFVRDPFARLFSGYIDKMFLPTNLAKGHAQIIFKKYRRTQNPHSNCEYNIGFSDFALYMADMLLVRRMSDAHFYLMSQHLNPCHVNVTYVGKMEHFMDDTNFILSSAGIRLSDVSGKQGEEFDEMHEKGYMRDIINRTFNYLRVKPPCISRLKVLQRLWLAFYIRGYLVTTQKMPNFKDPSKVSQNEFVEATFRAYDLAPNSKEERSAQRKEAMMEAFSTVPRPTLQKLALAYDIDCRLFDYNCNIDERFPKGKNIQPFYFES